MKDHEVANSYKRIKSEVSEMIESELGRMLDSPGLAGLIIRKR
ncbi:hypothetical protein [Echinicola rosea]|nr:hypothetical protein [Echinicola rosea]